MKKRIISFVLALVMVITAVPVFMLPAFAAENETQGYDYDKLYVGKDDGSLYFAADFFSATDGSDSVAPTGTPGATLEAVNAYNIYSPIGSKSDELTKYITVKGNNENLYGATPVIQAPWYTTLTTAPRNYKASAETMITFDNGVYTVNGEEVDASLMQADVVKYDFTAYDYHFLGNGELIYAAEKGKTTPKFVYGFTTDYILDTKGYYYYVSSFGNGYFRTGYGMSYLQTAASNQAIKNGNGDYTVEVVYRDIREIEGFGRGNGQALMCDPVRMYLGVGGSGGDSQKGLLFFYTCMRKYKEDGTLNFDNVQFHDRIYTNVNLANKSAQLTFSVDSTNNAEMHSGALIDGVSDIDVYVNGQHIDNKDETKTHTEENLETATASSSLKLGESASLAIYAIRVYSDILTEEEIAQNHFADIAKFYALPMYDYDILSDAEKAYIHNALADYSLTENNDEANRNAILAAYNNAYAQVIAYASEEYIAFMNSVMNAELDLYEYSTLAKSQKDAVVLALYKDENLTQEKLDTEVAENKSAEMTDEQYNALYVTDGLHFHMSFIGVEVEEEGLPITYTDGSTVEYGTPRAFDKYVVYKDESDNNNNVRAETMTEANTPLLYNGHIKLYNNVANTSSDTDMPISYGCYVNPANNRVGASYVFLKNNSFTYQIVLAEKNTSANSFTLWTPDMRFSFTGDSSKDLYTSTSLGSVYRWGVKSGTHMEATALSAKVGSTTYYNSDVQEKQFKMTAVNTYTVLSKKDFTNKTYTYVPKDYNEQGKTLTAPKTDAEMLIGTGDASALKQVISLPTIAGIDGSTTLRTSTEHFRGAVVAIGGEMAVTIYLNDVKAFSLAKQQFSANYGDFPLGRYNQGYAAVDLYAYRIYSRVLTEDELLQNNFADVAKYYELNVANITSLTSTQKKEIYELFRDVRIADETVEKETLQASYDEKYFDLTAKTPENENHARFLALAKYYSLDTSAFDMLSDTQKEKVYENTDNLAEVAYILNRDVQNALDEWVKVAAGVKEEAAITPVKAESLYVQKGAGGAMLKYHLSFLSAEAGGSITTEADFAEYELYKSDSKYYAKSNTGRALSVYDGYVNLSENGEAPFDVGLRGTDGKYFFQQGDYSVQVMAKPHANSTQVIMYVGDVRATVGRTYVSNTEKVIIGGISFKRWGQYGGTDMRYSAISPFKTGSADLSSNTLTIEENTTLAFASTKNLRQVLTYTTIMDKDVGTVYYTYNPSDYLDQYMKKSNVLYNTVLTAPVVDSKLSSASNLQLSTLTDGQKEELEAQGLFENGEYKRNSPTYFAGTVAKYDGRANAEVYAGTEYIGGIIEHSTLGKNYYLNDGLFKIGDSGSGRANIDIYALRVYSGKLSSEDIAQNNTADLAVYFSLDLTDFSRLDTEERKSVYSAMADYTLSDNEETVENAFEKAVISAYYAPSESATEEEIFFYSIAKAFSLDLADFNALSDKTKEKIYLEFYSSGITETSSRTNALVLLSRAMEKHSTVAENYGNKVVAYEGYSVRKGGFPGIRSEYSIDKQAIATLEKEGYKVTFGTVMANANNNTRDNLKLTYTDGEWKVTASGAKSLEVYNTEEGYKANYWTVNDRYDRMAYTTTYPQASLDKLAENGIPETTVFTTDMIYCAYTVITDENGESQIFYTTNSSLLFGDELSLYELSRVVKEQENAPYEMIQRVVNTVDGTNYASVSIAGYDIGDYSIVYDDEVAKEAAEKINEKIKEKTGVKLAVSSKEDKDFAIYVGKVDTLTDKEGVYSELGVYENEGNIYVSYVSDDLADKAAGILANTLNAAGNIEIPEGYFESDPDKVTVGNLTLLKTEYEFGEPIYVIATAEETSTAWVAVFPYDTDGNVVTKYGVSDSYNIWDESKGYVSGSKVSLKLTSDTDGSFLEGKYKVCYMEAKGSYKTLYYVDINIGGGIPDTLPNTPISASYNHTAENAYMADGQLTVTYSDETVNQIYAYWADEDGNRLVNSDDGKEYTPFMYRRLTMGTLEETDGVTTVTFDVSDSLLIPENAEKILVVTVNVRGECENGLAIDLPETMQALALSETDLQYSFQVVSDTHVRDAEINESTGEYSFLWTEHSYNMLNDIVDYYEAAGGVSSGLMIVGDVADYGVRANYDKIVEIYERVLAERSTEEERVNLPINYWVQGNHDSNGKYYGESPYTYANTYSYDRNLYETFRGNYLVNRVILGEDYVETADDVRYYLNINPLTENTDETVGKDGTHLTHWQNADGNKPYYSRIIGGSYFIFLGGESRGTALIRDEQYEFLCDELARAYAEDPTKPIFVFLHQPFIDSVSGSYEGQNGVPNSSIGRVRDELAKYENVIFFSGHSHARLKEDGNLAKATAVDGTGSFTAINTSSVAYLYSYYDFATGDTWHGSEGYFAFVYDGYVVVRGYDFKVDKWIASSTFVVDVK